MSKNIEKSKSVLSSDKETLKNHSQHQHRLNWQMPWFSHCNNESLSQLIRRISILNNSNIVYFTPSSYWDRSHFPVVAVWEFGLSSFLSVMTEEKFGLSSFLSVVTVGEFGFSSFHFDFNSFDPIDGFLSARIDSHQFGLTFLLKQHCVCLDSSFPLPLYKIR